MELILGILMLFGIASVGAEAETETPPNLEIESTIIESAPAEQPVPKVEKATPSTCFTHHTHTQSIYRDLTVPYGTQQRLAASCLQSCKGACSDE